MSKTIAFAGKGGTGKTTLCGMLIHHLCKTNHKPVLAVDADANSNLNEVLGTYLESSVGILQEDLKHANTGGVPKGIDKIRYAELKLNQSLSEEIGYDLMVMGRSQGKGCYCSVNDILAKEVGKVRLTYPYVVVDNEAGMEHISRGILPHINLLLLVSDSSRRGIQAAGRIAKLAKDMEINPDVIGLIVNRVPNGALNAGTQEEIQNQGLTLISVIGKDEIVYKYDCSGIPLVQIPDSSPTKQAIKRIAEDYCI